MILPKERDPRMITIRRGGSLTDTDHRLIAKWSADCAEHVLHRFESVQPNDNRVREAIAATMAWSRGEVRMMSARECGGHANGAARPLIGAPRFAAFAAGQAACVGHVPEHNLGAAAYAIRAAIAATETDRFAAAKERDWQRHQLPDRVRDLVLEDQLRRNDICWGVFAD